MVGLLNVEPQPSCGLWTAATNVWPTTYLKSNIKLAIFVYLFLRLLPNNTLTVRVRHVITAPQYTNASFIDNFLGSSPRHVV